MDKPILAVLILAHSGSHVLKHTINTLIDPRVVVLVHLDEKIPLDKYIEVVDCQSIHYLLINLTVYSCIDFAYRLSFVYICMRTSFAHSFHQHQSSNNTDVHPLNPASFKKTSSICSPERNETNTRHRT